MIPEVEWNGDDAAWRDPAQVVSNWAAAVHPKGPLLNGVTRGDWWDLLDRLELTLLVSREYEHLLIALSVHDGRPLTSYLPLPHPSGVAVSPAEDRVLVASTRSPNQIFELLPSTGALQRRDRVTDPDARVLIPSSSRFLPGALYLHELAFVDGELHANAVGENAILRIEGDGRYERVWWPRAVEVAGEPDFSRNYLQLNSIAAGASLSACHFSASADHISARRPGHQNFPVDRRGVVFSGATREPVVRGLTRPHSARHHEGRLWLDNSGYGEVGVGEDGWFKPILRVPGWTRGLSFFGGVAFIGASRVIPRFTHYAPGLDEERSVCGVFAMDVSSGQLIAAITWPDGNQIFSVECLPRAVATGLPFSAGRRKSRPAAIFFGFRTGTSAAAHARRSHSQP